MFLSKKSSLFLRGISSLKNIHPRYISNEKGYNKALATVHLTPTYLQQDDSAKNFFMDIGNEGLRFAWAKYFIQSKSPELYSRTKTDAPKNIVIVGAGFAGLSAAYELSQVGHKVRKKSSEKQAKFTSPQRMFLSKKSSLFLRGISSLKNIHPRYISNEKGYNKALATVHLTPTYLQQDDSAKNFFMDIGNEGLRFAWAKYFIQSKTPELYSRTKTDAPKNIVIVGAGFAGLSAAYELSQVGHKVSILELQNRVGGRAKTIYDGFSEGLHAEGGAMRLPLVEHFMTNHYIRLLGVPIRKFQNTNETNKTWINLFGKNIRMQDWEDNNLEHLKEFYPEAASFIESRGLKSIDELYEKTLEPVKKDLEKDTSAEGWEKWVERWSKYSVESFFRDGTELNEKELRPWPEDAIQAYKVTAYAPITNRSLAETMREDLGKWWSDDLWTPVAGMQSFAETFMERSLGWHKDVSLTEHINYGKKVDTIKVNQDGILVSGRCSFTGREFNVSGDAGIVTLPLPVLRQITIQDETGGKNIFAVRKVLSNVHYDASTKILLQCKSRFWEKDLGNGGFSRTNLPIGQIHYPSNENRHPNTNRAILLSYTWGQDAIMLGAQSEQEAVASAVRQLKHIHPEIEQYFEVGRVQAWTRDPSAQLAFVNLNPNQYKYSMETLLKTDTHPLHIAGEALSWSHGWIQGALESGLRAAYNIFCKYEKPILGQRKL